MSKGLNVKFFLMIIIHTPNPLTPTCDQDKTSPYNFNATSSKQVVRIKKYINYQISSWSNIKFSELTSKDLYGRQWGEFSTEILGVG